MDVCLLTTIGGSEEGFIGPPLKANTSAAALLEVE